MFDPASKKLVGAVTVGMVAVGCGGGIILLDEPWSLQEVQLNTDDGIRVLVLHDMEGLSGQDDPLTFEFGSERYEEGQELLVGDVNAVIDGLYAGGATEVHVVDGHGSGNPEPDILTEKLDPRASQVLRDEPFDTYFDLVERGAYDAVAVVGMHAKTGSEGFASHTYTLGIDIILNDESITETELVALSWGRVGVPVIFASGDDKLAGDLRTMPWIEFVTVKEATSASTAIPRPLEEARADLRAGAQRAVENLADARVMRVTLPMKAAVRAVPPASLVHLEGFPGVHYRDNTVSFAVDDLWEAYDGIQAVIREARQGYRSILTERMRESEEFDSIIADYSARLFTRWLDVESGRWEAPPDEDEPAASGMYHGYR